MQPDNSEIVHHAGGGVSIVGADAMLYFKAIHVKQGISLWMKTKMKMTRGVGIKDLLALTAQITKNRKTYKNTAAGHAEALEDITNWCATMKAALPITEEGKQ